MTDQAQPPVAAPPASGNDGGVPLWLPLLASIIALGFAAFIAIRICPTLSGLVAPPDPVLPPGAVLQSRESKGTEDQWVYTTTMKACEVARFYEKAWGKCVYDPGSGCNGKAPSINAPSLAIARCEGNQSISQFNVYWWTTIAGNTDAQGSTIFRIYRYLP
jgi:hypothetical protein